MMKSTIPALSFTRETTLTLRNLFKRHSFSSSRRFGIHPETRLTVAPCASGTVRNIPGELAEITPSKLK
jgi:hypothetical protein